MNISITSYIHFSITQEKYFDICDLYNDFCKTTNSHKVALHENNDIRRIQNSYDKKNPSSLANAPIRFPPLPHGIFRQVFKLPVTLRLPSPASDI